MVLYVLDLITVPVNVVHVIVKNNGQVLIVVVRSVMKNVLNRIATKYVPVMANVFAVNVSVSRIKPNNILDNIVMNVQHVKIFAMFIRIVLNVRYSVPGHWPKIIVRIVH
ncbi:hypothetical protein BLA29_010795 [Euroglyphus maynei]|uniref:Uncharacterized protein n=1 Tax=Euroglyphus maynei TaxID=6958 RepID=A0A1Y3B1E1_EURMA|nr:hypothetical protein BLA29_010795 [Euroglyphus maynei]